MIKEQKASAISFTKEVIDIANNQQLLLDALAHKKVVGRNVLLDGHFTLLKPNGDVQGIEKHIFADIAPDAIIIIYDDPSQIVARMMQRDNVVISLDSMAYKQVHEIEHGRVIAKHLNVPIYEITPTEASLEYLSKVINIEQ